MGVNYYSLNWVQAEARSPLFGLRTLPPKGPLTGMGWEIKPDALFDLLVRLKGDAPGIPLFTENGAGYREGVASGERVSDEQRQ